MNNSALANTARFIGLILLQVLILNNINFMGYINPYLYVLFILLYPFISNQSLFLILSFFLWLRFYIFWDSVGIQYAAVLISAFVCLYL